MGCMAPALGASQPLYGSGDHQRADAGVDPPRSRNGILGVSYQVEQSAFIVMDWERFEEFITTLESRGLFHALDGLKERHKKILFARLFGELTFREIGEKFGMTEKQAEAVYFYIITKLRKEMEGKRDEF